jgi:hypothetical protein
MPVEKEDYDAGWNQFYAVCFNYNSSSSNIGVSQEINI